MDLQQQNDAFLFKLQHTGFWSIRYWWVNTKNQRDVLGILGNCKHADDLTLRRKTQAKSTCTISKKRTPCLGSSDEQYISLSPFSWIFKGALEAEFMTSPPTTKYQVPTPTIVMVGVFQPIESYGIYIDVNVSCDHVSCILHISGWVLSIHKPDFGIFSRYNSRGIDVICLDIRSSHVTC